MHLQPLESRTLLSGNVSWFVDWANGVHTDNSFDFGTLFQQNSSYFASLDHGTGATGFQVSSRILTGGIGNPGWAPNDPPPALPPGSPPGFDIGSVVNTDGVLGVPPEWQVPPVADPGGPIRVRVVANPNPDATGVAIHVVGTDKDGNEFEGVIGIPNGSIVVVAPDGQGGFHIVEIIPPQGDHIGYYPV